jgi:O-antigen ligase
MPVNSSKTVIGLFVSVIFLLPFSRYTELPLLILSLCGIFGLVRQSAKLVQMPQFKILSIVFVSYFLMIIFSALDSYWQEKSFTIALASLRFYLAGIALLLYVDKKDIPWLFKLVTLLTLFWTIDALIQYIIGFDIIGRASYEGRLNGIFGEHHVKLGPLLALSLPIVMIAMRKLPSPMRWLSILLMIVVIILSGTRSAWIMMLFTLIAYWFHHVKQRRWQLLLKTGVIACFLVSILWFFSSDFQQRINRSLAIFSTSESAIDFALADRLSIWETSLGMIKEHPVNGVGARAFRKAYPDYADVDDVWQAKGGVAMHAHHWILEVLAETGIIGLIIVFFALYKLFDFVRSNYHQHYSWAFMIALISAFLPITSTYSIFSSFWSICIWFFGMGLILSSQKNA